MADLITQRIGIHPNIDALFESNSTSVCLENLYSGDPERIIEKYSEIDKEITEVAAVTVITSPNPITKSFFLSSDGSLMKKTAAQVYDGNLLVHRVQSLKEFGDLIVSLDTSECLTYGTPANDELRLMTSRSWHELGCPKNATDRTKKSFAWPNGAGILMLDYDAPKDGTPSMSREELFEILHEACPQIREADALWMPSTSSEIYNAETEQQISGIKGQRIYFMLKDASDIPRTGKALLEHLWANGHGRFEASLSGSFMERSIFDSSVWQTNRIDFAGGANCIHPLVQRRGNPILISGKTRIVDSRKAIPDLTDEMIKIAAKNKAIARSSIHEEAISNRAEWKKSRNLTLKQKNNTLPEEHISKMLDRAIDEKRLSAEWEIVVINDTGDESTLTVSEILADIKKYNHMLTLDPLEPDYDGRRTVGKLYLSGQPCLHSFAHGGTKFMLHGSLELVEVKAGRQIDAVNDVLDVMRRHPNIFDFGSRLVTVNDGKVSAFDESSLRYWLGGAIQFFQSKTSNEQRINVPIDPPLAICKQLLSLGNQRNLKKLDAVITAPTLRKDGTVIDTAGYDVASKLLLVIDEDLPSVPSFPTVDQAKKALDVLLFPFLSFPFVDEYALSAHLSALLTAACRTAMDSAPAFAYDAPIQASGKTLLAQCVAVLTTGNLPAVFPHISGSNDDEMRKRLFSSLLAGDRVIVLDNIMGSFDSAALATVLTTAIFQDRILGKSEAMSVPNKAIVLLTGNNMVLSGDMPRRVVSCRINPGSETPFARSFDLNPLTYCAANRHSMIVAALTLIRFYLVSGVGPIGKGKMASFEDWDHFVRQTILHINNTVGLGRFGDVMELIKQNQSEDPDRELSLGLVQSLDECFKGRRFTAKDVKNLCGQDKYGDSKESRLHEAITAISFKAADNASSIGRILTFRKDRILDGMHLVIVNDDKNNRQWQVVKSHASQ